MTIGDLREWVEALPDYGDKDEVFVRINDAKTITGIADTVYASATNFTYCPNQGMAFVECDPL